MDKKVYAAIITKTPDGWFYVNVPDMEIGTQGTTLAEAMDMAREAIGLQGISLQDIGQPIPEPTRLDPPHEKDEMVALIDVDFEQVREREDNRSVRKNCTIPLWMNREAEARHINFSAVLQDALRSMLG